ncbi:MAG: hypothetical protein JSW64_06795 [Candidatus Zixiibacteriota bacterium]|nr:MAG: hypothetical protein JSW64_06795 [candidate division Zixibacteria bacterium]
MKSAIFILLISTILFQTTFADVPSISVSPDSLYHSQFQHTIVNYPDDFTIDNAGSDTLIYSITYTPSWLTLTGASGSIGAFGSDTIDVQIHTDSMEAGYYIDSLAIISNDTTTPILYRPKIVLRVRNLADSLFWKDYNGPDPGGYMPDFDQYQDFNGDGQPESTYCGPVSVANSLWWFQGKYPQRTIVPQIFYPSDPPGFIDSLATLMETDVGGIYGTNFNALVSGLEQYLDIMNLTDLLYVWSGDEFDTVGTNVSILLLSVMRIEWIEYIPPPIGWIRFGVKCYGGHYITVAGSRYDPDPYYENIGTIAISDPAIDATEHGRIGITRGINHYHPDGHNDGVSASHDFYGAWTSFLEDWPWNFGGYGNLISPIERFYRQNGDTSGVISALWSGFGFPSLHSVFIMGGAPVTISAYDGIPDIDVIPDTIRAEVDIGSITALGDSAFIQNLGTAPLGYNIGATPSWLSLNLNSGVVASGARDTVSFTVDASSLPLGTYIDSLTINSYDPDEAVVYRPILEIEVVDTISCVYAIGDVNNDSIYNGLDIIYGVAYLKGGNPPMCEVCLLCPDWHYCGDVNGSCSYNGLDITYGVDYLKGGADPVPCADCPPVE